MKWKIAIVVALFIAIVCAQPANAGLIKRFFLAVAMAPATVLATAGDLIKKPSSYWLERLEEAYLQDEYESYKSRDWRR